MADIKLFVCCHRLEQVPKHPLLYPIQVGAALADTHFSGFLHDDTGDNISEKNRSYCELTAQYWAWKNIKADYYGFFHYRRYLYPDPATKRPYRVEAEPTVELLERLGYKVFSDLVQGYDLIVPKGEDMRLPVQEHYAQAKYHHERDLALAEEIVQAVNPEFCDALKAYLGQTVCCFGNIYTMSAAVFDRYCNWLFPILAEFDHRADLTGYAFQELRVDGYLAERLFGGFYTKLKAEGIRTLELPRVDFIPDAKERHRRQLVNTIFPPGTKRRATVKHLYKGETR